MPLPRSAVLLAWLVAWLAAGAAGVRAQGPAEGGFVSVLSESEQFTVFGPRGAGPAMPGSWGSATNAVRDLTPATLAVACERTKSRLLEQLGQRDRWRTGGGRAGKIFVTINPRLATNEPVRVQVLPFERAWQYRIELPPRAAEATVVRAVVQALLLELANRAADGGRPAEIPLWLLEGASQAVLHARAAPTLPQPESRANIISRRPDPLAAARETLARRAPLGFDDLGLPEPDRMSAEDWEVFSACAHLFFHELAALPDGRPRLLPFIQTLPRYYNWQHAFLAVWPERFPTLLEAAKWWALTVAAFTGRDEWQSWSPAATLARLEEVLHPPLWSAASTNEVVRFSALPLTELLGTVDYAQAEPALRRITEQLSALRLRAPATMLPLVDDYLALVRGYLAERSRAGFELAGRGRVRPSYRLLMRAAADRARELDQQRIALANRHAEPLAATAP